MNAAMIVILYFLAGALISGFLAYKIDTTGLHLTGLHLTASDVLCLAAMVPLWPLTVVFIMIALM